MAGPLVVYGHSHVPCDGIGVEGHRLFNPGSPTDRRAEPHHTLGVLDVAGGQILGHDIRIVGPNGPRAG